jgi:hypothetical protein
MYFPKTTFSNLVYSDLKVPPPRVPKIPQRCHKFRMKKRCQGGWRKRNNREKGEKGVGGGEHRGPCTITYNGLGITTTIHHNHTVKNHPVVLLNSLTQLIFYIIQHRLVRIVEGSNILEPRTCCMRWLHHQRDSGTTSTPFLPIDVENVFNTVTHENLWVVLLVLYIVQYIPHMDLLESI